MNRERDPQRLLKHTDLIAAVAVVVVVTMLVIPLPPMLLDLFITINISGALAVVVATMYLQQAAGVLGLPEPAAADHDVPPGDQRVGHAPDPDQGRRRQRRHATSASSSSAATSSIGLVIFLILVVIQFVVVTNGAGRVAEVAARFTLDAMPGKQMAIDADLNAGLITDAGGAPPPQGDRPRGRLLRRDGRCLEVRQGRRDGRRADHRDQPDRRDRRRRAPAPRRLLRRPPTPTRC